MAPPVIRFANRFIRDESGATAIEYGLLLALMFLAILGAVTLFADNATTKFNDASDAIVSAGG
jgi:pilus assembly protein Flp/PilA